MLHTELCYTDTCFASETDGGVSMEGFISLHGLLPIAGADDLTEFHWSQRGDSASVIRQPLADTASFLK